MTRVALIALWTGALACSGGDKPAAEAPRCDAPIASAIDGMIAQKSQGKTLAPERLARMAKLRGVLLARCTEDAWSSEMLACISTITTQPDLMRCQRGLPPAQQQQLQAEIVGAMMSGGGGMPGGHGQVDAEAQLDRKLVELQEQTDLLVRAQSEARSVAERTVVTEKIEKNRAEKLGVETQLRELRNRKAAGGADGSAGSPDPAD